MKNLILLVVAMLCLKTYADIIVIQNVSPGASSWPGSPVITTLANPSSATANENFASGGGNTNLGQTFTVSGAGFILRTIEIYAGGGTGTGAGTNLTLSLYDLGTSSIGTNSYAPYIVGGNLFGSGAGLPVAYSNQASGIVQFDFTGADQVQLQAGHTYAFEVTGVAGTTPLNWLRPISDTYAGGAANRNRSQIIANNTPRDFPLAVYTNHPAPPPPQTGRCTVNWNQVFQRIDGFGASSAWRYSPYTAAQNLLFFSTNRGVGLSLLRNHITSFGTTTELPIMLAAQSQGARIWSTPWTPPGIYKDNGSEVGGNFVSSVSNYQGYANQLANYVRGVKNGGVSNLYALSIQNEPDFSATYESCLWKAEQFHEFVPYLRAALASNGVASTRILLPEQSSWNFSLAAPTLNDTNTLAMVDIVAAHNYGGTPGPVNTRGKALWETEMATLGTGAFDGSIANGITWARQIHTFLTVASVNAWHYWWLVPSGTNNEGLTDINGAPAKRLFVVGNYSRFVRPNYYRIGTVTNLGTALVSAYKDSASPTFAIVAINPGAAAITQTFSLTNFATAAVTPWITSGAFNATNSQPAVAVSNYFSFDYLLPAMSVVTFVGSVLPPAPTITAQPVGQTVSEGGNVTFTAIAVGTPPLRYQWKFGGTDIANATNTSLTLSNVQFGAAGGYSVKVSDAVGSTNSSIALLAVNRLPVADPQTAMLDEDMIATITLTGSDADGDSMTFSIVTAPGNGTLSGTAPNLVYHPKTNYFGPDSFTFKVNDGSMDSGIATVTINVLPVNDAPLAYPQSVSLNEDGYASITLKGFDEEGIVLLYTVNVPAHGALSGVAPNLIYTPVTNYFGPDSFTFKVNDGQVDSAEAVVTINVLPVNDAPVAKIGVSPLTCLPGVTNLLVIACNNTNAAVMLDGMQSWDAENDPLQYSWFDGTNLLATSVSVTNDFAVGTHDLTLLVNDGHDTAAGVKTVEVITPAQSIGLIIDQIDRSALSRNRKPPLISSLQSAAAAFDRESAGAAVNQLQAFQNKLRAQVAPLSPTLAQAWSDSAQTIIDASCNP